MNRIEIKSNQQYIKYNSRYIINPVDYKLYSNIDIYRYLEKNKYQRDLYYEFYGYSSEYTLIEISPEEMFDLSHNKFSIKSSNISPGAKNKVYFSDSTFPSLLLGRLGLNLSRTTKPDNADIIVSDCELKYHDIFHGIYLIDNDKKIIFQIDFSNTKKEFVDNVNKVITFCKTQFNYDLKFYCNVTSSNFDTYELYQQKSSKFITTDNFTKYVISQLPVLQEAECDNICYMLKSSDKATVNVALGTLQYYNFFECGIDLLNALSSSMCYDLPNNREAEYIYHLLGIDRSEIIESKGYRIKRKIQFLMNSLNKFIITPSMTTKEKVVSVLRQTLFDQISNDYKEEFDRLDVTLNLIPNDKNGETNASSSEVEGEKL